MNADTIIQYFGIDEHSKEVEKSTKKLAPKLNTALKSNVPPEKTRNLDNKTMKSLNIANKINPNVSLKFSSKDKTKRFSSSKHLQSPKRKTNKATPKMENFAEKGHPLPESPDSKSEMTSNINEK